MLSNFDIIKNCFGSDDDDDEKFVIKQKKSRKVSYHPDESRKPQKQKKKNNSQDIKKKFKKPTLPITIPKEQLIFIDEKKFSLEKKKYDIEYDNGNIEYKLKLCDVNENRIQELTTQMKFRLEEGCGECFYEVGVEDNGNDLGISKEELEISLSVLNVISTNLNCKQKIVKLFQGKEGLIAEVFIKKNEEFFNKIEITIGVLGDEGTGKSTLIGVLINGILDNGKGLARTNVFRHKHEILKGKTSSMSHQILGFDQNGETTNYGDLLRPSVAQIVNKSTKIINFYDMAGSAKTFNKTTVSTLSSDYLDYLLFVISAKDSVTKNTEELLRFIYNVDLPFITIINKIDLISENELKNVVIKYKETIKKINSTKIPVVMKNNNDVVLFSSNMDEKDFALIFLVSNLTWEGGLTLFKNFLNVLPQVNNKLNKEKQKQLDVEKMEFDVHEIIYKETNVILVGIVSSGKLRIKSKCYLGPDSNGNFKLIEICDIHCKKVNVTYSYKGQYCSVCIKSLGPINTLTRDNVKKGMSLIDIRSTPIASKLFEIELWTIDGNTKTFKISYQPVLNIKHVRQGVRIKNPDELFLFLSNNEKQNILEKIVNDDKVNLSNIKNIVDDTINKKKWANKNKYYDGDEITIGPPNMKKKLLVEFMFNPEYISVGQNVIINDQSLKAYGVITKIFK